MDCDHDLPWPVCVDLSDDRVAVILCAAKSSESYLQAVAANTDFVKFLVAIRRRLDGEAVDDTAVLSALSLSTCELGNAAYVELVLADYKRAQLPQVSYRLRGLIENGESLLSARANHALGAVLYANLDFDRALIHLTTAEHLFAKLNSVAGVAQVADSLANVLLRVGRNELACAAVARSVIAKNRIGDQRGIASSVGTLGRVLKSMGRNAEAIWCLRHDLELIGAEGHSSLIAMLHGLIGQALWASLDPESAMVEFRSAMSSAKQSADVNAVAHSLADLLLHGNQGESAAALDDIALTGLDPYAALRLSLARLVHASSPQDVHWQGQMLAVADAAAEAGLPEIEVEAVLQLHRLALRDVSGAEAMSWLLRAHSRACLQRLENIKRTIESAMLTYHASVPLRMFATRQDNDGTSGIPQIDGFVIGEQLGKGGFGSVYDAYDIDRGERVALKIFDTQLQSDSLLPILDSARLEIMATTAASYGSMLKTYAIGHDGRSRIYVVSELISGKSLAEAMAEGSLADRAARIRVATGLVNAVRNLHASGVIHRDLKPANILLRESNLEVVLIDLGSARIESMPSTMMDGYGTSEYMAPELQENPGMATTATDCYAVGMILRELFAISNPESSRPFRKLRSRVRDIFARDKATELTELTSALLRPDPFERLVDLSSIRFR